MSLTTCPSCPGFVPPTASSCPHCDAPVVREAGRRLAQTAAGGALAMTLMACYGGAGDYTGSQWPTTVEAACNQPTPLSAIDGNAYAIAATDIEATNALVSPCSATSGPERVFHYDPGEAAGQSGLVTILWDSGSQHSVYLVQQCGDSFALACGEPAFHGSVEMTVQSLEGFDVVVDSVGYYDGNEFELQVVFEPDFIQ